MRVTFASQHHPGLEIRFKQSELQPITGLALSTIQLYQQQRSRLLACSELECTTVTERKYPAIQSDGGIAGLAIESCR